MQFKDSDQAQLLMRADEGEISFSDIVEFIQDSWKPILAAGIVGATLGFGGWSFFGSYKAELILLNSTNTNTNTNTNNFGIDLVTWRILQKSLPNLASQILADERLSSEARGMYRSMGEASWWSKSVVPTYAISKADVKDLAGITKALDGASTTILAFNIHTTGRTGDSSMNSALLAAEFIKSGGAYLQVKNILKAYEGEVIGTVADIQNQITSTEIEQTYLRDRVKSLEELLKRFPGNTAGNQQVVDPKESGAKYLPLTTQIIAVNNDINQNKELLIRLNDRLNQLFLMRQFLAEALPLAEVEFNGILLSKSLLTVEEKLRQGLARTDFKDRQALYQLRTHLLTIEARFTKGLEVNSPPVTKKTGMIKNIGGGLVLASFAMLVFLLGRRFLKQFKKNEKIL